MPLTLVKRDLPWQKIDPMITNLGFLRHNNILSCAHCPKQYRVNGFAAISITVLAGHANTHPRHFLKLVQLI